MQHVIFVCPLAFRMLCMCLTWWEVWKYERMILKPVSVEMHTSLEFYLGWHSARPLHRLPSLSFTSARHGHVVAVPHHTEFPLWGRDVWACVQVSGQSSFIASPMYCYSLSLARSHCYPQHGVFACERNYSSYWRGLFQAPTVMLARLLCHASTHTSHSFRTGRDRSTLRLTDHRWQLHKCNHNCDDYIKSTQANRSFVNFFVYHLDLCAEDC